MVNHLRQANPLLVAVLAIACLFSPSPGPVLGNVFQPGDVEGLEAWWRADSLTASLDNGDKVVVWKDQAEHEHDLTSATGVAPDFYENQINGKPIVYVRKGAMSMATPFSMQEHTIFVVYKAEGGARKAFFHGASDSHGILLRRLEQTLDTYQSGDTNPGNQMNYGTPTPAAPDYRITVLAREKSRLRSWFNGEDVSSNTEFPDSIPVNGFFFLKQTTAVKSMGNGLGIAEMLFYDRYLPHMERESVTQYLSGKYGIPVVSSAREVEVVDFPVAMSLSLAQLSTTTKVNINDTAVAIPWDIQDELDSPFRHDPATNNTQLFCAQDGIRVRLYVSLPLTASVADVGIRVLFRLNGATFLRGEGRSCHIRTTDDQHRGWLSAEVITRLSAGDYVEVVTLREGAKGTVTIDAGAAVFIAEVK